MADTIQIVQWALGQTCSLRNADALTDIDQATSSVGRAQTYSNYLKKPSDQFGIFGDVCVTGYTSAHLSDGGMRNAPPYPCGGFVISETFSSVGGAEGLQKMCATCPANTRFSLPAGCVGSLFQRPESPETQTQLENIISRLGLEREFQESFLQTSPIWYGLWAQSPLSPKSAKLLNVIIGEMHREDTAELAGNAREADHLEQLGAFVNATELALRHELQLHVALAPLGHTDCGWYTVFPHCPRCNASARLPHWRRRHPTQLYACHACGMEYPPAETSSQERMSEREDLREAMGIESFKSFAVSYLQAFAVTKSDAEAIVESTERWELERTQKLHNHRERMRRKNAAQNAFARTVLFASLHPVYPTESDEDNESDLPAKDKTAYFSGDEFAELLKRCQAHGVKITMMQHRSTKNEDLDRLQLDRHFNPTALLATWQKEGCCELFGAWFDVPARFLEGFDDSIPK